MITDEMHRVRSASGEEDAAAALAKHPLPAEARNGGDLTADPNSREQIMLNRGDFPHTIFPECVWLCVGDSCLSCET